LATEKQKMLAGELYVATGGELATDARRAALWMDRYNAALAATQQNHPALLREIMASVGEGPAPGRPSSATTATTSAWATAQSSARVPW
jgi:hypothetical protein